MAEDKGDLHFTDEFHRTKRNVLWACSSALLLGLVAPPADGQFTIGLLGGTSTVPAALLKLAVWSACAYNFIGFWRQVGNVDRLNSEAVYTKEFNAIKTRLVALEEVINGFVSPIEFARNKLLAINPADAKQTEAIRRDLYEQLKNVMSVMAAEVAKESKARRPSETSLAEDAGAKSGRELVAAIDAAFDRLKEAHATEEELSTEVSTHINAANTTLDAIQKLGATFDRLSGEIRTSHRTFYTLYDKWGTVAIFIAATVASFWHWIGLDRLWQ